MGWFVCWSLISSAGFQSGAYRAVQNTNIRLLDWLEFQGLFEERWYDHYFVPFIIKEAEALIDYTEPFNSRVLSAADSLSSESKERSRELRNKYALLGVFAFETRLRALISNDARVCLPLRGH